MSWAKQNKHGFGLSCACAYVVVILRAEKYKTFVRFPVSAYAVDVFTKLTLVFMSLGKTGLYYAQCLILSKPLYLSGSLKWLDYKVNSTGTEGNSILLKK